MKRHKIVSALALLYVFLLGPIDAFSLTCADLDGSYVFSQETSPVYLGFFGSQFASDSIMNTFGTYGNQFNALSVRNEFGTYGSPFSIYSANNSFTTTPPKIYKYGGFLGYLTTNTLLIPGVSLEFIDGNCVFFSAAPITEPPPPPPAPTGVTASDGTYTDKIVIAWNPVGSAQSYDVYVANSFAGSRTLIGNTPNTQVELVGGTPGTVYHFWVYSRNAFGQSATGGYDTGYRAVETAPPDAPNSVVASDGTFTDRVAVTWSDVSGEDYYEVHRCSTSSAETCIQIASPAANVTNFDDTGANADGTVHYYRMKACSNANGCSDFSVYDEGYRAVPDLIFWDGFEGE